MTAGCTPLWLSLPKEITYSILATTGASHMTCPGYVGAELSAS